jgi:hypothetical protein
LYRLGPLPHGRVSAPGAMTPYPPDTTLGSKTIQPMSEPAYLTPTRDPTFGNLVTRIEDRAAFRTSNTLLDHSYSTSQPWNADSSMIATGFSWNFNTVYLQNGTTGAHLRTVHPRLDGFAVSAYNAFRWSNVNPNVAYGIADVAGCQHFAAVGGGNQMVVWHPESATSSTPTATVIHTFSQYDAACPQMNFGEEKGQFANDDSLGIVAGYSSSHNSWGITTFRLSNVSSGTPAVSELATYWFGPAGGKNDGTGSDGGANFHAVGVGPIACETPVQRLVEGAPRCSQFVSRPSLPEASRPTSKWPVLFVTWASEDRSAENHSTPWSTADPSTFQSTQMPSPFGITPTAWKFAPPSEPVPSFLPPAGPNQ